MLVMPTQTPPPPIPSNPFASRYVRPGAITFRASSATSPPIDNIFNRLREVRCGVIVGNHGTGKSTLLQELAATLSCKMPGVQWVQLTQGALPPLAGWFPRYRNRIRETISTICTVLRVQHRVAPGGVFVIDGAEQLPAVIRWLIAGRSRRASHFCLLTSHHDITGFETLYRTALTTELIEQLLNDLLTSGLDASHSALHVHLKEHIATMDLASVTKLRDLWDELYEVVQSQARVGVLASWTPQSRISTGTICPKKAPNR